MNIAVRYYTRSGNTRKLAEAIGKAVGVQALDVSAQLTEKTDILFLGSSVYAADIDDAVKEFLEKNSTHIGKIVNFSTAAIARSTYQQVKKCADRLGIAMSEEEFHCKGSFAILHKNRPNEEDLNKATFFAKEIVKKCK